MAREGARSIKEHNLGQIQDDDAIIYWPGRRYIYIYIFSLYQLGEDPGPSPSLHPKNARRGCTIPDAGSWDEGEEKDFTGGGKVYDLLNYRCMEKNRRHIPGLQCQINVDRRASWGSHWKGAIAHLFPL